MTTTSSSSQQQQRHVHHRRRKRPASRQRAMLPPLPPEALTASRRKKPHNPLPAPSPDPPGMGEDDPTADDSSGLMGSAEVTGAGNATAVGPSRGSGAPLVRAEEAMIVCVVLLLWVGAIALFFNRWGKIRMLEPYQPKFQPHRPSCPLLEMPAAAPSASPPACPQRLHCSKLNVSLDSACPAGPAACPHGHRPRQNSVFVAAPCLAAHLAPPPRKAKSAVDLQQLLDEHDELLARTRVPRVAVAAHARQRRASTLLPPLLPTVPDLPLTVEPPTPECQQRCRVLVEPRFQPPQPPPQPPAQPQPALLRVTHV